MTRQCLVCNKAFKCSPSDKTVTCSKECSRARKSTTNKGKGNAWSEEAIARKRSDGQTDNLKKGTAAALESPNSGRFETNINAKEWILIAPDGREIYVKNLNLWARENCELFGKPSSDKSANQITSGFKAIAQTLAGKRGAVGKPRGAMTYFGWTLKDFPN